MEEILELQTSMASLTLENDRLKSQLRSNKHLLEQLQHSILQQPPQTKHKRTCHHNELYQQKMSYYNEHKQDTTIINQVRKDLDRIGYKTLKTIPWQLIKYHTDEKFDSLSSEEQSKYKNKNGKSKQDVGL